MSIGISAFSSGISMLDAINSINSKDKNKEDDKNNSLEEIFDEILDQISENLEKQIDRNNGIQANANSNNINFNFGPPSGLKIEGLENLEF